MLKPSKENNDGRLRQVSKQGVIGLSYGMGHTKFYEKLVESCGDDLEIAYKSQGFSDGLEFSKHVVDQYRNTFRKIAALPRMVYQAYQDVVSGRNGRSPRRIGHHPISISYNPADSVLSVKLPTGSTISYREVKAELLPSRFNNGTKDLQISYQSHAGRKIISFSTLIENVIQAMARDILGQRIVTAEDARCDIRTHSHDEVVTQIPRGDWMAQHSASMQIFEEPMEGFSDLPLACKGFVSDRYTKDEEYMNGFMESLGPDGNRKS